MHNNTNWSTDVLLERSQSLSKLKLYSSHFAAVFVLVDAVYIWAGGYTCDTLDQVVTIVL